MGPQGLEGREGNSWNRIPRPIIRGDIKLMSYKDKENSKLSPRQLRFLELFFSGFSIKNAARAAGYRGSSDQALCNTGRAILRRARASETGIFQLFLDMTVNDQSESDSLKCLNILSKAFSSRR